MRHFCTKWDLVKILLHDGKEHFKEHCRYTHLLICVKNPIYFCDRKKKIKSFGEQCFQMHSLTSTIIRVYTSMSLRKLRTVISITWQYIIRPQVVKFKSYGNFPIHPTSRFTPPSPTYWQAEKRRKWFLLQFTGQIIAFCLIVAMHEWIK